jgi:hypothetical protein
MATLRSTIAQLANDFAAGVLDAVRGASLAEILSESSGGGRRARGRTGRPGVVDGVAVRSAIGSGRGRRGRGGRLSRRSADDIAEMVDRIASLLERHPRGLRAEQIRDALGVQSKELPRPLAEGLARKRLTKHGQKRATTYFAGGRGASAGASANGSGSKRGRGRRRAGRSPGRKRGAAAKAKASRGGKAGKSKTARKGGGGATRAVNGTPEVSTAQAVVSAS